MSAGGESGTSSQQSAGITCPCQAGINGESRRPAGGRQALILTQVPSHQVGIVEILHGQSHDVDEFLYDLHELHRSGIDLDGRREMGRHAALDFVSFFHSHKPASVCYRWTHGGTQSAK